MKYALLVLSNFKRHKLRTALTILSIIVAFVLFVLLGAIRQAFSMGVELAGADRLVVRHRVSLIQLLPADYETDIERIAGVADAAPFTWFGGIYKEPRNNFPQYVVEPEGFFTLYPEYVVPEAQKQAWLKTRTGVLVGRNLVNRFEWKIGDKIPIQGTIWHPKNGGTWEFDVVGIIDGADKGTDTNLLYLRQDFLEENKRFGQGMIGWYTIRIADPKRATEIATTIDELFANSPAETKTETEGAFVQAFADQVGNIGAIVKAILAAVFFTILLVAGTTMAQTVRERTHELGVLKALGFTGGEVLGLVLAESLMIAGIGGGTGLALGGLLVAQGDPTGGLLPMFIFPERDMIAGIVLVALLGIGTGLLPALQAMRLNPVDALRRD
ncbi:MAG: ABC transporter permease [Thermoanaerobaculia bacterium]